MSTTSKTGASSKSRTSPAPPLKAASLSSLSSFNLGVYVNRVSCENNLVANMASMANQRPIEVFFGGDMNNVKWGLGLDYAMFHSAAGGGTSDTNLVLHAGAEVADFEPFGWATLVGNEKTAAGGTSDNKYKTYGVGLRYKMGEWLPYLAWREDKVAPNGGDGNKADAYIVGLGRTTKIGEGARMNYSVAFVRQAFNNAGANSRSAIPLDISVEADANSWLTARAGLSHNIYDRTGETSTGDNTTGRIGLGVHVGKGDIDWTVGKQGLATPTDETLASLMLRSKTSAMASSASCAVGYHW